VCVHPYMFECVCMRACANEQVDSIPKSADEAGSAAKPKQPASFGQDLQGLRSAAMR